MADNPARADTSINSENSHKFQFIAGILFCGLFTFLLYSNTAYAPFVFDDNYYIVANPDLRSDPETTPSYDPSKPSDENLRLKLRRPVPYLSFSLNYKWGGLNPVGYHLANILLHILVTITMFIFTRKILFLVYHVRFYLIPILVALLFASHPLATEAVSYVSHRSESLAALFYLLALLLYIKTAETQQWIFHILSLSSFALALLSKETAATLPAVILIFDVLILSGSKKETVAAKFRFHWPYWAMLLLYIVFQKIYFGQVGFLVKESMWSSYTYAWAQFSVVCKYLRFLAMPAGLCFDHFILPPKSFFEPRIMFSFFVLASLAASSFIAYRKNPTRHKLLLFSCLWFFVTLSPTSSFMPIFDAMAERRVYLPSWGFFMGSAILLAFLLKINLSEPLPSLRFNIWAGLLGVCILAQSRITWERNKLYLNPILLWKEAVARYPLNPRARINLAKWLARTHEPKNAISEYKIAAELLPNKKMLRTCYHDAGQIYLANHQYRYARESYERYLILNPDNPEIRKNLGFTYAMLKNYALAEKELRLAVNLEPEDPQARVLLAGLYVEKNRFREALEQYQKALKLSPDNPFILEQIGKIQKKLRS